MQSLSLYLDLNEGELADLEVVARISLSWVAAIKEIGEHVAPGFEFEVKFESGSKGSLSLNGVIQSIKRIPFDGVTVRVVIVTSILFILKETTAWGIGSVLDWLNSEDAAPITIGLTDHDKQDLAERVAKELASKTGQPNVRLIFKEAEKDQAIKGIGSTTDVGKRPQIVVPRETFSERYIEERIAASVLETRSPRKRMDVVIIRPFLKPDIKKSWRFQSFTGEFSATVKDLEFLEDALSGNDPIPLREGIILDVLLEVKEQREAKNNGAWEQIEFSVIKVYGHKSPVTQGDLLSASPSQNGKPYNNKPSGKP